MYIQPFTRNLSTLFVDFSTTYTQIIFRANAIKMLTAANSARSESNVVNAPAPASKGKTNGTNVASLIGP